MIIPKRKILDGKHCKLKQWYYSSMLKLKKTKQKESELGIKILILLIYYLSHFYKFPKIRASPSKKLDLFVLMKAL